MLFDVLQLIIIDVILLILVNAPCMFEIFSIHATILLPLHKQLACNNKIQSAQVPLSSQIIFQTIECSLYGILPSRDTWTDHAVQVSTQLGLATGEVYTVTCMETVQNTNRVMLTLPGLCQILLLPMQPLIRSSLSLFSIARIQGCTLHHRTQ